jgi:hypothetical protein
MQLPCDPIQPAIGYNTLVSVAGIVKFNMEEKTVYGTTFCLLSQHYIQVLLQTITYHLLYY